MDVGCYFDQLEAGEAYFGLAQYRCWCSSGGEPCMMRTEPVGLALRQTESPVDEH